MVPPRGVTWAKPSGSTEPNRQTLAGNAVSMCSCSTFGIFAIAETSVFLSHLIQSGRDIARRHPAQIAHSRLVEVAAAMHRRTGIPDDEVALPPIVAIDELALRRVLDQLAEQQAAFGHGPPDDLRGMRGDVEYLALRPRMRAHDALGHRRQHVLLAEQQVLEAELAARPG